MNDKIRPFGQSVVTTYLCLDRCAEAIDFYKAAFDAVEPIERFTMEDGKVAHAEILVGKSCIKLSDESPAVDFLSPESLGGCHVQLHLEVPDVDAVTAQAARAGATVIQEPADQFYGERVSRIVDPFGYRWLVASRIEDMSDEELRKRARDAESGRRQP